MNRRQEKTDSNGFVHCPRKHTVPDAPIILSAGFTEKS